MSSFKNKLNKAKEVYEDMTLLVKICKESNSDVWGIYWDSFWDVSRDFPFKVEWYESNTIHERVVR